MLIDDDTRQQSLDRTLPRSLSPILVVGFEECNIHTAAALAVLPDLPIAFAVRPRNIAISLPLIQ